MSALATAEVRRPDAEGKIDIGRENRDHAYAIQPQPNGDILLSPVVVRHEREGWLFENPGALQTVLTGIAQAGRNETTTIDLSGYPESDDPE